MEVYCKNCRRRKSKKTLICKLPFNTTTAPIIMGRRYNPGRNRYFVPDEFGECPFYKRKWWKFWVA